MNKSTICAITSKWLTILRDYEKIKSGNFSLRNNLFCVTFFTFH
ncbi:MAG: hypothetical protein AB1695_14305 [Stygiobacter sp.]